MRTGRILLCVLVDGYSIISMLIDIMNKTAAFVRCDFMRVIIKNALN